MRRSGGYRLGRVVGENLLLKLVERWGNSGLGSGMVGCIVGLNGPHE
jgi:hypothetical protein